MAKRAPVVFTKSLSEPDSIGYVYLIVNLALNKPYVGIKFKSSFDDTYWGSSDDLNNDIELYGIENFSRDIIEWVFGTEDDLRYRETYWIDRLNTYLGYGYNKSEGGGGGNTIIGMDEESKRLRLQRQRESWTDERKQSQSENIRKFYESHPEELEKKREFMNNHNPMKNPEISKKFSGENNYFYDKHYTGEQNYFYGKQFIGRNNPTSKPIVKLSLSGSLVETYDTLSEACNKNHISHNVILECCRGKRKSYKGYKWSYESDYLSYLQRKKEVAKTSENCIRQREELHNLEDLSERISNGLKSSEKFQKSVRENNKKKRIPVGRYSKDGELLEIYESIKHASRCGFSECGIQYCIKGKLKTSGGYIWKRVEL